LTVIIAGVAWGWVTHEAHARELEAQRLAHQHAEEAADRVVAHVLALPHALESRVRTATAIQGLQSLVKSAELPNDETFADMLSTEAYWAPFRAEGSLAIFVGGALKAAVGPAQTWDTELLRQAEAMGVASKVLPGAEPLLAAAAVCDARTPQGLAAVVAMAQPLTQAQLEPIALQERVSLSLGAGNVRLEQGASADLEVLRELHTETERPCCAVRDVVPGLPVQVFKSPATLLTQAKKETSTLRFGVFGGAGLLGLLVLLAGFWPRATSGAHVELLKQTSEELQRSREELARLSQVISQSGSHVGLNERVTEEGFLATQQTPGSGSRYRVLDLLGEGGMARVYVAYLEGAEGFRRLLVVKRLKSELTANQESVNQFIDEARLGASLAHPNIIPVLDFGRDKEGYFLAQEYLVGRTIDALVQASVKQRGRGLEPEVVLYLAQEALKALGYAHARTDEQGRALGLVHRDVSPNNLMVTAQGEVKLLDFGIVKSEQRLTRTQTGMVKGNLFYMSPEQAQALEVDARSDLYSLGLVLFTAATGETLISGTTSYELLTRTALGLTPVDVARLTQLPAPLSEILLRALATDPAGRYASAAEFGRAVAQGPVASAEQVAALIGALLGEELAQERTRFTGKAS
jgi:hypothetical protein